MPYSIDPEENRNNAKTPSIISMENQLIYRIGSLESKLDAGFKRLDEKFDRLQADNHERMLEQAKDFAEFKVETRVCDGEFRTRIETLERWQNKMIAYGSAALAGVTIIWTLFGPAIRYVFGIPVQ